MHKPIGEKLKDSRAYYERLLKDRDELKLEIINWKLEYERQEDRSVEKLSVAAVIANLKVQLRVLQKEIFKVEV